MRDHTKYHVWRRAIDIAAAVHRASESINPRAVPGLRSQLRRAAASIPANISEGAAQQTDAQFARFVTIALASLQEVENHLAFARSMGALTGAELAPLTHELTQIRRMAIALHRALSK
jgi:four helix bundle protein